jgi:CRP/FNR family transcriptional regulator
VTEALDRKIAALGSKRRYRKDTFLFLAQEEAKGFFYVVEGEVRVFRMDDSGREIEIVRLRSGEFLGEAIALASEKFPAFARASRDTEVLFFERRVVLRTIRESPAAAEYFVSLLARKCILLNERLETLGSKTVRQRLALYLLAQSPDEGPGEVRLTVKKFELARYLGTIGETLSRTFRRMERDGLIQVSGGNIRVLDRKKVSREAGRP